MVKNIFSFGRFIKLIPFADTLSDITWLLLESRAALNRSGKVQFVGHHDVVGGSI